MNDFLEKRHRTVAGANRTPPQLWLQLLLLCARACLLALAVLTTMLNLGNSSAFAQQSKSTPEVAVSPAGNAESGKKIYTSVGCYEYHDLEGQGGAGTGPRLAPSPIAFPKFVQHLRQPSSQMPPYTSKVLSDAEVADIYAFLQSIPKPPAASSIPLLQGK
jgi:mono/diheme cytochrome c family protein